MNRAWPVLAWTAATLALVIVSLLGGDPVIGVVVLCVCVIVAGLAYLIHEGDTLIEDARATLTRRPVQPPPSPDCHPGCAQAADLLAARQVLIGELEAQLRMPAATKRGVR